MFCKNQKTLMSIIIVLYTSFEIPFLIFPYIRDGPEYSFSCLAFLRVIVRTNHLYVQYLICVSNMWVDICNAQRKTIT